MKVEDSDLALGFESGVPPRLYPSNPVEVVSHCTGLPDNFVEHSSLKLIHFYFEAEDIALRIISSFLLYC
jgi:hypothetical protein